MGKWLHEKNLNTPSNVCIHNTHFRSNPFSEKILRRYPEQICNMWLLNVTTSLLHDIQIYIVRYQSERSGMAQ